jgi:uncharacterized membrane protein
MSGARFASAPVRQPLRRARGRALRGLLLFLAIAAVVHLLAVWALPRAIMWRLSATASAEERAGVYLPPMTDATQRRIVMPSPDLLYATCSIDVSERPLRIRAEPKTPNYWSIALYASNSDNHFVLNDRQAGGAPVDLVVVGPKAYAQAPALPPGARVVNAPTPKGLLLMRVLVADYAAEREVVEAARRTLRCEPL